MEILQFLQKKKTALARGLNGPHYSKSLSVVPMMSSIIQSEAQVSSSGTSRGVSWMEFLVIDVVSSGTIPSSVSSSLHSIASNSLMLS